MNVKDELISRCIHVKYFIAGSKIPQEKNLIENYWGGTKVNSREYALYKGEDLLAIGTINGIAKELGVKETL